MSFHELIDRTTGAQPCPSEKRDQVVHLRSLSHSPKQASNFHSDFPDISNDSKIPQPVNDYITHRDTLYSSVLRISGADMGHESWGFLKETEIVNLYINGSSSHIPSFDSPNLERFPLYRKSHPMFCILTLSNGIEAKANHHPVKISPRANFILPMPKPEPKGESSIQVSLELATITGPVKFVDGKLKNGKQYVAWVVAQTEDPVDDSQVQSKCEAQILATTGVRFIEHELFRGYDPKQKGYTQEIELNHDLEPSHSTDLWPVNSLPGPAGTLESVIPDNIIVQFDTPPNRCFHLMPRANTKSAIIRLKTSSSASAKPQKTFNPSANRDHPPGRLAQAQRSQKPGLRGLAVPASKGSGGGGVLPAATKPNPQVGLQSHHPLAPPIHVQPGVHGLPRDRLLDPPLLVQKDSYVMLPVSDIDPAVALSAARKPVAAIPPLPSLPEGNPSLLISKGLSGGSRRSLSFRVCPLQLQHPPQYPPTLREGETRKNFTIRAAPSSFTLNSNHRKTATARTNACSTCLVNPALHRPSSVESVAHSSSPAGPDQSKNLADNPEIRAVFALSDLKSKLATTSLP
ncbi:hypothetical protein PCASD_12780 [Puccinia coronata f. sp. avenae]|uniref:Uncharacterized protein n=1 Tax=Puccinia coronata f. sp. avenae TaxID=200324 RepID=A0A2N5SZ89_9BASI|nr:hypothetical protein PCASD_12780 [Puccinia coronata f. sp. avenae]